MNTTHRHFAKNISKIRKPSAFVSSAFIFAFTFFLLNFLTFCNEESGHVITEGNCNKCKEKICFEQEGFLFTIINNMTQPGQIAISAITENYGVEDGILNLPFKALYEDKEYVVSQVSDHAFADDYMTAHWQVEAERNEFWVLHALRVAPEYEGRGFAKQMLKYIIEIAPSREQKAIRLDVLEGYEVESLYHRLGFQYIDTIDIFYEDIGFPRRFRVLEKVI